MANEGARTSFDINQAVSEAVASAMSSITESISSVIDTRLQAFKEENSQTVEAAVKRARHDRYERNRFNYRPNAPSTSANFQRANQSTSQMQFSRSEPYWRPHGMLNSRQEGPCYKLSICLVLSKSV